MESPRELLSKNGEKMDFVGASSGKGFKKDRQPSLGSQGLQAEVSIWHWVRYQMVGVVLVSVLVVDCCAVVLHSVVYEGSECVHMQCWFIPTMPPSTLAYPGPSDTRAPELRKWDVWMSQSDVFGGRDL